MREAAIQDAIRAELGDVRRYPELVLWRNNTGQMIDRDGRRVVFGCGGKGGADLIGIWSGRFVALEVKSEDGRQTPEQQQYQALVEAKGGVYALVRSVDEAREWAESMREIDHARARSVGGCTCRSNTVACALHAEAK